MAQVKYINRHDREISHIFYSETTYPNNPAWESNSPICHKKLGIWKKWGKYSSTVTDKPQYKLCKRCNRVTPRKDGE